MSARAAAAPPECIFCKVVLDHSRMTVVFEDEECLGFLDHRPLFHGHCLLIPKTHFETFADLPLPTLRRLTENSQLLHRAVEKAMKADGIFIAINNRVSQSIPHLHIHIVPRRHKDGLKGFFWPRRKYESDAEVAAVGDAIKKAIAEVHSGEPAGRQGSPLPPAVAVKVAR